MDDNPFLKNKNEWLTPDFMQKLAQSPNMIKAFQNPAYLQAFEEFGKDPKKAMEKYGHNPEFRELMKEFS